MKFGKLEIYRNGIEYGWCHFYWWNWLPKDMRYFGFKQWYYDGPLSTLGLWFTNICWRTPLTKVWEEEKK